MGALLINGISLPKGSKEHISIMVFGDGVVIDHYSGEEIGKAVNINANKDLISRRDTITKILGQPPDAHYPSWYAHTINEVPPVISEQ